MNIEIFEEVRVPKHNQRAFISLWHNKPHMSIVELARQSELSRPTCYRIIELLEQRGDIRGQVINGEPVASRVRVSQSSSAGDISHYRRVDLVRVITMHEAFVKEVFRYLCLQDEAFRKYRNDDGDIDLPALTSALEGRNRVESAARLHQNRLQHAARVIVGE